MERIEDRKEIGVRDRISSYSELLAEACGIATSFINDQDSSTASTRDVIDHLKTNGFTDEDAHHTTDLLIGVGALKENDDYVLSVA